MRTNDLFKLLPKKSLLAILILLSGIIGLFFLTSSVGIKKVQKVYNVHVPILERSSINLRLKDKLSIALSEIVWKKDLELLEQYQLVREFLGENQQELAELTKEADESVDSTILAARFNFEDKIIEAIEARDWKRAKNLLETPEYVQAKASSDEALSILAENLSWKRIQFLESQETDLTNSLIMLSILSLILVGLVANIARSFVLNAKQLTETQAQLQRERDLRKDQEKFISLGKMAGGLAHEFNNPLMIISAKAQNLEKFIGKLSPDDHPKVEKAIRNVKSIYQTVRRVTSISQALLTLSGSTTQREESYVSLEDLIEKVIQSFKTEHFEAKFDLRVDTLATSDYQLYGVRSELEDLLYHLFQNAVEANSRVDKEVVKIESAVCGNFLTLSVIDQGEGIKTDIEDSIFEPFITNKALGDGMGLGLALARTLGNQNHAVIQYKRSNNETHFEIVFAEQAFAMKQLSDEIDKAG